MQTCTGCMFEPREQHGGEPREPREQQGAREQLERRKVPAESFARNQLMSVIGSSRARVSSWSGLRVSVRVKGTKGTRDATSPSTSNPSSVGSDRSYCK